MPNITKYMGRAIPGMSMVQGAWDAGQGVLSLGEALARKFPTPERHQDIDVLMKSLKRMQHNKRWDQGVNADPRALEGTEERLQDLGIDPQLAEILTSRVFEWEYKGKSKKELKKHLEDTVTLYSKDSDEEMDEKLRMNKLVQNDDVLEILQDFSDSATPTKAEKHILKSNLERYLNPTEPEFETIATGKNDEYEWEANEIVHKPIGDRIPARNSIWMSVLDAMKRQEKK